jgi:hypothetical protein
MRIYLHLLRRHLMQHPGRAALGLLVLTFAAILMLALAGAGAALRFRLGAHLTELFPEERLTLEAGRLSIGPLALESRPIGDATLEAVRERAEVRTAWPVEPVRIPLRIEGTLFGEEYTSDAVVYGVPRELVADALAPGRSWTAPPPNQDGTPASLPVVVSSYFLDIYNLGLARANGLPLLSPAAVIGRKARLVLGESATGLTMRSMEPVVLPCHVAGLTSRPSLLGLALPAEVVRRWNQTYAPSAEPAYVQLVVDLAKGADREAFLNWAGGLGLRLTGGDASATQLKQGVRAAGWGLIALAVAIFALGMLTFYLLFAMTFHARRLDLIRLRAMGLSPGGAVALALGEVAVVAVAAVALAGGAVALAGRSLAALLASTLEQFTWFPAAIFAPAPGWLLAVSTLILALTLLPALPMLRWVVRVEPAHVIRDL